MVGENTLDNIFTDYDESIFSDGSIDPMGLRIIWTSLGSKIFHNKLNTISTDIRLYTLNLFHHYILQQCVAAEADNINRIIRKKPYFNKSDLFEGIIIFLENLLIHAAYNHRDNSLVVPGVNKLGTLKNNISKQSSVEKVVVSREKGILVRQYLLGIHGRHKGPFIQMGILNDNPENAYSNQTVWKEAAAVFKHNPWRKAAAVLADLIKGRLLQPNNKPGVFIEYKVDDVLTPEVSAAYLSLLKREIYVDEVIRSFWLSRLGLNEGTAGILYKSYLNQQPGTVDYQQVIVSANRANEDPYLQAITAIEPLLTLIDKCINQILSSATTKIDEGLISFIRKWLKNNDVNPDKIKAYLTVDFFNQEAIKRLSNLLDIYTQSNAERDFIISLIKYHQEIMKSRGNLSWVSIGDDDRISVHRPVYLSEQYLEFLQSKEWVNTYYLPTVDSLHKGLSNEAA